MNYQASWQEKSKRLPEEIFVRLKEIITLPSIPQRALLTGLGIELFLPGLAEFLSPSKWKIFISQAKDSPAAREKKCTTCQHNSDTPSVLNDSLVYLKGEPNTHLASLPEGIFDLVISLWDLPSQISDNAAYTKNLYRLLKKGGYFSIITHLDGSPELPLNIIKKVIHRRKLPLKIFKSALPDSTKNFRKTLNQAGFGDVRIWKDSITCPYQSAKDLYDDVFSKDEETLFMDNTTSEQRIILKEEFTRVAKEALFPLAINYDFAGGVGVKP